MCAAPHEEGSRIRPVCRAVEGWLPEWGGQLELWNQDVSERLGLFDPILNRCIIFATSEISYHGVTKVTCPQDVVRRSFAGYYYTEAAPPHWTGRSHPDRLQSTTRGVGQETCYGSQTCI